MMTDSTIDTHIEVAKPADLTDVSYFMATQRKLMADQYGIDSKLTKKWVTETCSVDAIKETLSHEPSVLLIIKGANMGNSSLPIIAMSMLNRNPATSPPELFGNYVHADFHRKGIGRAMLKRRLQYIDNAGLNQATMYIAPLNRSMLALALSEGFTVTGFHTDTTKHWDWLQLSKTW